MKNSTLIVGAYHFLWNAETKKAVTSDCHWKRMVGRRIKSFVAPTIRPLSVSKSAKEVCLNSWTCFLNAYFIYWIYIKRFTFYANL